ncbi:hypothetical protein GBAR_LOCUS8656 [Geodia barretti]|uniref:Uncharacterized protein n=1 Tax=Geodia barretti TaxID=519541 RepID=A0AA35RLF2_GEOBA|nr:hypothetical protein GBAR_LOCUS8656 [Geodia barretti]
MEELTEQIAGEIGPKWVQLLFRLRLDYRERYKLCAKHKDVEKNEQEANCTRDTIRLWQNGLGSDVPEMEVMTQLLAAFKTVKGFDERAGELAKSRGISLTVPQPPTTSSHEPTASTSAEGHPLKHSPSQLAHHTTVDTGSTLPAFSPDTPSPSSTVEAHTDANTEEGGSDAELSNLLPSHRPSAITAAMQQEQQVPKFGSRSSEYVYVPIHPVFSFLEVQRPHS